MKLIFGVGKGINMSKELFNNIRHEMERFSVESIHEQNKKNEYWYAHITGNIFSTNNNQNNNNLENGKRK